MTYKSKAAETFYTPVVKSVMDDDVESQSASEPYVHRAEDRLPTTPRPFFLTPPATEEERHKLNIFRNWVASTDCKESDLAMMGPETNTIYSWTGQNMYP